MVEAMGGFFELELNRGAHPYLGAKGFNSGRSAFQAVLLARATRKVWLPHFICSVMTEAAGAVGVEVSRYRLDDRLELLDAPQLQAGEQLLYVDYFGLKAGYIRDVLAPRYAKQLIVDNSQALFSSALPGIATFYSPRKFVGVPDGGWLVNGPPDLPPTTPGTSTRRLDALLGRLVDGPEAHYQAFQNTEQALGQEGLRGMSVMTERLLDSLDYAAIKVRRSENLARLHSALGDLNRWAAWPDEPRAALCYPLLMDDADSAEALRRHLLKERIYVPFYWREVLDSDLAPDLEKRLSACLLPLPVDQRYDERDMERLASAVLGHFTHQKTQFQK